MDPAETQDQTETHDQPKIPDEIPAETQDQTETHDQPKIPAEIPAKITTEVKKERIKNPKRVEQGKKLAEWNKANKKRLSRRQLETPPLQIETSQQLEDKTSQLEVEDKTSQLEVEDEASQPQLTTTKLTTKLTTKKTNTKSKDYFLIAETILIISLVGAGLFFYTTTTQKCSNKAQLKAGKAQLETATKKATATNIATNNATNKSNEDDYFEM